MQLKSWWAKVNGGLEKNLFFRFTARMVNWTWRKVSDAAAMELLLSKLRETPNNIAFLMALDMK